MLFSLVVLNKMNISKSMDSHFKSFNNFWRVECFDEILNEFIKQASRKSESYNIVFTYFYGLIFFLKLWKSVISFTYNKLFICSDAKDLNNAWQLNDVNRQNHGITLPSPPEFNGWHWVANSNTSSYLHCIT